MLATALACLLLARGPSAPPANAPDAEEAGPDSAAATKAVGWLEKIVLPEQGLTLTAKLDTGAKASALDAEDLTLFERDGKKWARFVLHEGAHGRGEARTFELPILGEARVRPTSGEVVVRPVVAVEVCLAGEKRRIDFTLGDRTKMNYRMLIGRDALQGHLLVDSGRRFTAQPGCALPKK